MPDDREDDHSVKPGVEAHAHHLRLATTPPHSVYRTFAAVKWGSDPQVDEVSLGWARVGAQPVGRRQRLTCADVRSGLLSRGRAGGI